MAKKETGKIIKFVMLRRERDWKLMDRLGVERDRSGDSTLKDTVVRLLNDGLLRADMEAERTGATLSAAMRPAEGAAR